MKARGVDGKPKLVIVLAHPRTGSSLLMQTLKLLGAEVVGSLMREDLPPEANPRGYFEDKHLLSEGMTEAHIGKIELIQGECLAAKVALAGMLKSKRLDQWRYWQERGATILVPVRHPLETALSRTVFNPVKEADKRFIFITKFLWKYSREFSDLARILIEEVPLLLPNIYVVPYDWARHEPVNYIERVAAMAGIVPDAKKKVAALTNIDPSLYRYRLDDFDSEYRAWDKKIGASKTFEILLGETQPWQLLSTMIKNSV